MDAPLDDLPSFRYHPDPVLNGTFGRSDDACESCGLRRGWIYSGKIDGPEEIEAVCPWCIASGRAHESLGVEFASGYGLESVPAAVQDEIVFRTPAFIGWQEERWLTHCGDAAAFISRVGAMELGGNAQATESLRREAESFGWPADQTDEYLASLDANGMPTAYLFRCLHCGTELAYSDFT